jgi:hypothetical protein
MSRGLRVLAATIIIGLASTATACGGDNSGTSSGSVGVHFALPAEKKLSELSESDALAACQAAAGAVTRTASDPDVVRFECTLFGVLASGKNVNGMTQIDLAGCKRQQTSCIADPKHAGTVLGTQTITCDPANVKTQFAGCAATLGDVQACLDASMTAITGLVDSITCDSAAKSQEPLRPYRSLPETTARSSTC